jgi:transposase
MAQRNRSIPLKPGKSRALTITQPNAAGIDIGSASHFVAVPPDRDAQPVREFPSFTVDLNALADWLTACGVDTVAMESTGVYWIPLFELLEARGFTVLLVNARHVKNVSGRKSDVLDCQWLLAALKDVRIHASADEIAKSLQGNWRAEHLFALKQALQAFDFVGTQLVECDCEIEAQLQSLQAHQGEPAKGKKRSRARNAPKFDLRGQLFKMCGVDLTRIDGIDVTTALAVISETGTDMSRFASVAHFASWLGLCPGTRITGGKVMSGKTKRVAKPSRPGAATGRRGSAHQPVGTGRVLQAHVLTHGQTQSRRRRSP